MVLSGVYKVKRKKLPVLEGGKSRRDGVASKVEVASVVRSCWVMDVRHRGKRDCRGGGGIRVRILSGFYSTSFYRPFSSHGALARRVLRSVSPPFRPVLVYPDPANLI